MMSVAAHRYSVDGIGAARLPSTHWGSRANSSQTPNACTESIPFDELREVKVLYATACGIKSGEHIMWDYPVVDPPSTKAMSAVLC